MAKRSIAATYLLDRPFTWTPKTSPPKPDASRNLHDTSTFMQLSGVEVAAILSFARPGNSKTTTNRIPSLHPTFL
jgi:hypothetical protein